MCIANMPLDLIKKYIYSHAWYGRLGVTFEKKRKEKMVVRSRGSCEKGKGRE